METKKFTNLQDFMRFLNYSKEDIWVKNNKAYNASKNEVAELIMNNKDNKNISVRFQLPSDEQLIDTAILFNDGKLESEKLSDMVGMCQFVIDRLYENGDIMKPSSKEGN